MKNLFIYCDGGFGNRFGTLLGGIYLSDYYELNPIIIWPSTKWCRLKFDETFKTDRYSVLEEPLDYFKDKVDMFIMHENFIGTQNYCSTLEFSNVIDFERVFSKEFTNYLYNNNVITKWIDDDWINKNINNFKFSDYVINKSFEFININKIDQNVIGVHLRATDFHTSKPNFDKEYKLIESTPQKRYFVLSDDFHVEERFSKLDNVLIRPKTKYVEKIKDSITWNDNIERSKESVIESLIDLTILSKTDIMVTSPSSFLRTSILLQRQTDGKE